MEANDLAARLKAAYMEGFSDGQDHGNIDWKYPPPNIAWRVSFTRRELTGITERMPERGSWIRRDDATHTTHILDEPDAP